MTVRFPSLREIASCNSAPTSKAMANHSHPKQAWSRTLTRARTAMEDLGILAQALEDDKQAELFTPERVAWLIERLIRPSLQKTRVLPSSTAYMKLEKLRSSKAMRQLESDISNLVNLEASQKREREETVDIEDFESIRVDVIENLITPSGKKILAKREKLQKEYGKALEQEKEAELAKRPDIQHIHRASAIGIVSLQYCKEESSKIFDDVMADVASKASFDPTLKVLQRMYDKTMTPAENQSADKYPSSIRRRLPSPPVATTRF